MIALGSRIPLDLVWRGVRGGERLTLRLAEIVTRRTLFSVHLRSSTRTCDQQVAGLTRVVPALSRRGCQVVALSRDTIGVQARYAAELGLSFLVLSDPDFAFSRAVDAMVEKTLYGRKYFRPLRAGYVIDPDGAVRHVIAPVDAPHFDQQISAAFERLAD